MALGKTVSKYRKVIMLSLIVLTLVICITATYITGYQKNKVTAEDVFAEILTEEYCDKYSEVSSEEFLSNFEEFHIYQSYYLRPYDETKGYRNFKISATKTSTSKIKNDVKIYVGLGANWVGYKKVSKPKTFNLDKISTSSEYYWRIEGIEKSEVFPIKGNLWFTKAKEPTLYVLVEWTNEIGKNNNKYTILEYDYETFTTKPVTQEK